MAYAQFFFVCLFFGSNFILMDRATRWFGPYEVGFGRVVSATVFLALLWATIDRRQRLAWRNLPAILGVGVIANAYPYVVQPALIETGLGHSFFGMTVAFTPLLTILVSIPMLGIHPTTRQMVGVLGGLVFVLLLMYDGNVRGLSLAHALLVISVPLSYAVGNTLMRRSLNEAPPTALACSMLTFSTMALLPTALSPSLQAAWGAPPPSPREDFATATVALLILGSVGTGACIWAFVRMIQSRGPLFAGMVTYVVPVVAMLWGLLDREEVTTRQLVAIAGTLSMVALVQAPSPHKPQPTPEEKAEWAEEELVAEVCANPHA